MSPDYELICVTATPGPPYRMNDIVFPGIWGSTTAEMVNNPSRLERSEGLDHTSKVAQILPRGIVFPKAVAQVCSDQEDVTDVNCR